MARRGVVNYQKPLKAESEWQAFLATEDSKLTLVEVHVPWCGSSSLMTSIVKSIALKIDEWEKRIEFLVVSTDVAPDMADKCTGSKPKFLFYQKGKVVAQVDGMNTPELNRIIAEYLPELEE